MMDAAIARNDRVKMMRFGFRALGEQEAIPVVVEGPHHGREREGVRDGLGCGVTTLATQTAGRKRPPL